MNIIFYNKVNSAGHVELRLGITDIDDHPDISASYIQDNTGRYDRYDRLVIYPSFFTMVNTDEVYDRIAKKVAAVMCSKLYNNQAAWHIVTPAKNNQNKNTRGEYYIQFITNDTA